MPLTKSFNELVQNRAANDPDFAAALLREGSSPACPPNPGFSSGVEVDGVGGSVAT